jgi:hypothetical protein
MAQLSLQHCFSFKALWISVKCEKRHGDVFLGVLKQQHNRVIFNSAPTATIVEPVIAPFSSLSYACLLGWRSHECGKQQYKKKKRLEKKEHRGDGREDEMKAVLRWAG